MEWVGGGQEEEDLEEAAWVVGAQVVVGWAVAGQVEVVQEEEEMAAKAMGRAMANLEVAGVGI